MNKFVGTTDTFVVRYWTKNNIPPVAARYLGAPIHPIRPKIVHMLAHRDKNTLWWRVSVNKLLPYKRVVRSWCARRVRIAFEEALRQQGLDRLGKRIPESSAQKNLTGSMEIYIQVPCVVQSFEDIRKDANKVMAELMAHQSAHESAAPNAQTPR
ncbi:unnamed protein product [Penicillium salamii]|nr:unnamed protein product [Penicillium salamii]CAG8413799.1 unnamed protein product [Penicillium salamii]